MRPLDVLAVVSGDISADQDRWPCGCGGRAAGRACRRRCGRCARWCRAIRRSSTRCKAAWWSRSSTICSAARRASSRRSPPGSTCSCSMRRICSRATAIPIGGPDGRDWPDNAFRFAALARVAALLGAGAVSGYRPDIVHAHDWQAGLAPAYLHYAGGARPAYRHDGAQPGLPGTVPRRIPAAPLACRRMPTRSTASSITAASAI